MKRKRKRTLFFLRALTPTKPHFKCFLLLLLIPRFFRFFRSLMFFFGFLLRKTEGEALGVWIWNVKRGRRRRKRRRKEKEKKSNKTKLHVFPLPVHHSEKSSVFTFESFSVSLFSCPETVQAINAKRGEEKRVVFFSFCGRN